VVAVWEEVDEEEGQIVVVVVVVVEAAVVCMAEVAANSWRKRWACWSLAWVCSPRESDSVRFYHTNGEVYDDNTNERSGHR
jgi:hypothetical protein